MASIRFGSLILLGALAVTPPAAVGETYQIVLRVNDRIATTQDYLSRRADRVEALRRAERLSPEERQERLARVGEQTMSELFEELLLLSRADQLGIEVSSQAVERAIANTREQMGVQSEEDFEQALAVWGTTREKIRQQMLDNLRIREVMTRDVRSRIELGEEDLRRYYQSNSQEFQVAERVRLAEVVVLDSSGLGDAEAALLAAEIRQQLLAGRTLDEVVEDYAGQEITTRPIDLGWVEMGDLDAELEAAVWSLEPGQVSEPVAARGGIHLLQVVEREEARIKPFTEVAAEIEEKVGGRRFAEKVQEYMEELEARAYVVARPPPEAAGFRERLEAPGADLGGLEGLSPVGLIAPDEEAGSSESGAEPEAAEPASGDEPDPGDID